MTVMTDEAFSGDYAALGPPGTAEKLGLTFNATVACLGAPCPHERGRDRRGRDAPPGLREGIGPQRRVAAPHQLRGPDPCARGGAARHRYRPPAAHSQMRSAPVVRAGEQAARSPG